MSGDRMETIRANYLGWYSEGNLLVKVISVCMENEAILWEAVSRIKVDHTTAVDNFYWNYNCQDSKQWY